MIHLQPIVSMLRACLSTKYFPCGKEAGSIRQSDLPGVDDTRDPTQDRQTNVDQEVGVAASLEKDRKRRQEEGQEVEADVASGGWHDVCG